jgi:TonB family protein
VAATLDASGNVREVSVLRSSNVEFYDEVAVASIRQAQPFQPPPPSMFSDGQVRLAFTFTLYPPDRRSFVLGQPLP